VSFFLDINQIIGKRRQTGKTARRAGRLTSYVQQPHITAVPICYCLLVVCFDPPFIPFMPFFIPCRKV
jgi:hypothetical protein